ncbi:MAG: aldo/keto reductase [Chitinophagales bacterium]|nr:aldo/keto reductase [Chitinophagales bacterium]
MTKEAPIPILGTAMWGWTTPKEQCFEMLTHFYEQGWREVDAATNYPINKKPEDFRLAEKILEEWVKAHGIQDLKVMMKVGSLNNMRTPDHNLSKSFLLIMLNEYQQRFDVNLDTFMIHWDNRDDIHAMQETFEAFEEAQTDGLRLGLSGIRHPELYHQLNKDTHFQFRIQIKHNLLYSDYERYQLFHESGHFITYGINAGGLKLSPERYKVNSSLAARGGNIEEAPPIVEKLNSIIATANQMPNRPAINSMNQCGMIYAYYSPGVSGILLGTSKLEQLQNSLAFHQQIKEYGYADFYQKLLE